MKKNNFTGVLFLMFYLFSGITMAQTTMAPTKQVSNLSIDKFGNVTWTNGNGTGRTVYLWNAGINKLSTAKNPTAAFSVTDNTYVEVVTPTKNMSVVGPTVGKVSPTGNPIPRDENTQDMEGFAYGSWVCIYDGTGSKTKIPDFGAGNRYYLCVFEYNGTNGAQVYNKTVSRANYLDGWSAVPPVR